MGQAQSKPPDVRLLEAKGDLEAAEPLFRRELGICEAAHGDDHAETGASARNLADLLQDKGDYDAAEPLFRRALAIDEAAPGWASARASSRSAART